MKYLKRLITVFFISTSLCSYANSDNFVAILKSAMPSVVNISSISPASANKAMPRKSVSLPQDMQPKQLEQGSGVIIDAKNGYIVTNDHVVGHPGATLMVTFSDGQQTFAKVVGMDADYDLAVIQFNKHNLTQPSIKALTFANSANVHVGQPVAAIGSPFGLEQTATQGIISALDRNTGHFVPNVSFIQTDAAINPGNSGGALINEKGELIGINTAILSPTGSDNGIGLTIPSNLVKAVCHQLITYGKINYGVLGVTTQNLNVSLKDIFKYNKNLGVIVTQVVPGSPAYYAGIQAKDIIINIRDLPSKTPNSNQLNISIPIKNSKQLENFIRLLAPKTEIIVTVQRQNHLRDLKATIADPRNKQLYKPLRYFHGVRLENYTELLPNSQLINGAEVIGIQPNSSAALAGLQIGDIIIQANYKNTRTINELIGAISEVKRGQPILVKVKRQNLNIYLAIYEEK